MIIFIILPHAKEINFARNNGFNVTIKSERNLPVLQVGIENGAVVFEVLSESTKEDEIVITLVVSSPGL